MPHDTEVAWAALFAAARLARRTALLAPAAFRVGPKGVLEPLPGQADEASLRKKRDEHLRAAGFLSNREFPQMIFTAAEARPVGDRRYQVQGQLELLGQSRPLTLEATWNRSAEYPFGGGVFGGNPYVTGVSARGSF